MSRPLRSVAALVALVLVTGPALAACGSGDGSNPAGADGTLQVVDATVDRPLNPRITAVRLVVDNRSARADTLVSVASPVAEQVSLHRSTLDDLDRSSMEDVDRLAIPARSQVTFEPGGLHVMLEDLERELAVGDTVPLTFTFAEAGPVAVTATVTEPGGTPEEHSHE